MTKLNATIPDDLHRELIKQAEIENLSTDELIARSLRASVALPLLRLSVNDRAIKGDWVEFDRIMSKVPDIPPVQGDEIE